MKNNISKHDEFYDVFQVLSRCTDDYFFILDLKKDHYTITEKATEVFKFDKAEFDNAMSVITDCVYIEDRKLLADNIRDVKEGILKEHDLEYRWLDKHDNIVWISCRGQVIREDGQIRYLVGRVTELGRKNKIDNLTGLYREIELKKRILNMTPDTVRNGFLLLIGIDNFKDINEKYGKIVGDQILLNVAECICRCSKGIAKVYRMGGDEIMVFCENLNTMIRNPAKQLYKKIQLEVMESIAREDYSIFYTVSGGSVEFSQRDAGSLEVMEKTEFALRQAKQSGKNMCIEYDEKEYEQYLYRLDLQECLRRSAANNFEGFELYFQPIVNIKEKCILGAEALLRWENKQFGKVAPDEFISLLEESGLIIPVGRWIIDTAMKQCLEWQKHCPEFRVNINLSFVQLKKSDVLRDIDECIEKLNFNSKNVLFEITESGELDTGYLTGNILDSFRKRSLNLGIDDFGTGYSNLKYIRDMMFNLVKIDKEFISNIRNSQYDYTVVKQFTELAHILNLKVCYEGVETKEDFDCVMELEPDYIQGFYFAKPVSAKEFEERYLDMKEVF